MAPGKCREHREGIGHIGNGGDGNIVDLEEARSLRQLHQRGILALGVPGVMVVMMTQPLCSCNSRPAVGWMAMG